MSSLNLLDASHNSSTLSLKKSFIDKKKASLMVQLSEAKNKRREPKVENVEKGYFSNKPAFTPRKRLLELGDSPVK